MRIRGVTIHNYRSIRDLSMRCEPMETLLGPNNHGKSNILAALEFALTTSAKPAPDDLFRLAGDDREVWVELTFEGLSEQEGTTFKKHLQSDGTFTVRKVARFQEDGKTEIAYRGWSRVPKPEYLHPDKAGELATRSNIENTPLHDLVPTSGRLTRAMVEEAQQKFIQAHARELEYEVIEGPFMGEKNIAGGLLPDFYLIPAVRDLSEEARVKNTTTFGRLLNRAAQEMAAHDPRFQDFRAELDHLVGMLNRKQEGPDERPQQLQELEKAVEDELQAWGVKVAIEFEAPEIEKVFELGTSITLDDGVKTLAEQKGHGLQRAVIFGLMRAWARILRQARETGEEPAPRKASESLVFGFEEPELFLHPQAQRRLQRSLEEIALSDHHQVFVCTHSSHFVDLERHRSIGIVTKRTAEEGSTLRQCVDELFAGEDVRDRKRRFHMARWVNPDRAEMFFARKTVFVEGETEAAVLPFLAQKLGCLDPDVSVIDCGSKFNLRLYIAIANAFKLRYLTIHDEDPIPDPTPPGWTADDIAGAKRTFIENREIQEAIDANLGGVQVVAPDFEVVAGVTRSQVKRKGKALAAIEHFETLAIEAIPERISELVKSAYGMES